MNNVYIIYEDDIYEVSKYINKHPGEGINNVYIKRYNYKNCTSEFNRFHMTDEPFQILEKVKNLGTFMNIHYVCKNYFKNRIPKCFYFNKDDLEGNLFIESNDLVLIPINDGFTIKYRKNDQIIEDKIIICKDDFFVLESDKNMFNNIEDILSKIKNK